MNIDRILLLLETDHGSWTLDDPLIRRAATLAQKSSASLLLLHVCYDNSLGYGAFVSRDEIDAGRLRLLAASREQQARLKQEIQRAFLIEVDAETTWSHEQSTSVLRTAQARDANLIMKASGDHSYFLGLLSNDDWELLREADTPVWFVAADGGKAPEAGIIAAVEQSSPDGVSAEEFQLDHAAFETAKQLSDRYASPLYAVHAYQPPRMLPGFEGYLPILGAGMAPVDPAGDARTAIARRHGQVVQDFIDEHGIPLDDLVVAEGPVEVVLSSAAESKEAGLIVMGSSSKSWWDRFRGRASAEPTLAQSDCDVLFVKAPVTRDKEKAA